MRENLCPTIIKECIAIKKVLPCFGFSPEDLEGGQHSSYDVTNRVDLGHGDQRDLDSPGKAQDHVLQDGTVIIGLHIQGAAEGHLWQWSPSAYSMHETLFPPLAFDLVRIDYFLSQEGVLSGSAVEQAPIHAQVPD